MSKVTQVTPPTAMNDEKWAELGNRPHFVISMSEEELDRLAEWTENGEDGLMDFDVSLIIRGFNASDKRMRALSNLLSGLSTAEVEGE